MANARSLLALAQDLVRRIVPGAVMPVPAVSFTLLRAADRLVYDSWGVPPTGRLDVAGFCVLFWLWLLGPLEQRRIASLTSASRVSPSSFVRADARTLLLAGLQIFIAISVAMLCVRNQWLCAFPSQASSRR